MQTPSFRQGPAEGLPLTHSGYIAACAQAPQRPWVQVRKRHPQGPCVLCGQVIELHGNDGQWFKVETGIGALWAEGRNVRLCPDDGRCTCCARPSGARGTPCFI